MLEKNLYRFMNQYQCFEIQQEPTFSSSINIDAKTYSNQIKDEHKKFCIQNLSVDENSCNV